MPPPLPPLAQALKDTPGILMKNLKESQGWNSRTDKKFVYTRHDYYFLNLPIQRSYVFNVVHLVCVVLFVVGLFNFFFYQCRNGRVQYIYMLLSQ